MLKNILNLKGTQHLSKTEQESITGGRAPICCIQWVAIRKECLEWDSNCFGG